MRQVIVKLWCNPCLLRGILTEATERRTITYEGRSPREESPWMCEQCAKELDALVAPYLIAPDADVLAQAIGADAEPEDIVSVTAAPETPKAISAGANDAWIEDVRERNKEMRDFADARKLPYRKAGTDRAWTYVYPVALRIKYEQWVKAGRP